MEETMKWQTMEGAPKDGTRVLVFGAGEIFTAEFTNQRWIVSPTAWEGDGDRGGLLDAPEEPTHWMPLPSSPVE